MIKENKLFKILTSVKLAIILLISLGLLAAISTLMPLGQLENFFSSALFITLMFLFFINLSLCTIKRIYRELVGIIEIKVGVDLIHTGLMLLILSSTINAITQEEYDTLMNNGDVEYIENFYLKLDEFNYYTYSDGKAADWVSHITILDLNGAEIVKEVVIEVNKPYRFGDYRIFQKSFTKLDGVKLSDKDGKEITLYPNYEIFISNMIYQFLNVDGLSAMFKITDEENNIQYSEYKLGSEIEGLKLVDRETKLLSGIYVKKEPVYVVQYISLLILLLGFSITYIDKFRNMEVL